MMNQGVNTQTVSHVGPNSLEVRCVVDAIQPQSSYLPSTSTEASPWTMHRVDNHSTENGISSNATCYDEQQAGTPTRNAQQALNAASLYSATTLGEESASLDYNGYVPYPNGTDSYSYASSGYAGYYNGYQQQPNHSYFQQQPNHAYPQPVGPYQNTGAPYQPISSFQNTGSYAGTPSYTSTYYNPRDYQTAGAYPSSGYRNQTSSWNNGNYAHYSNQQYTNYNSDSTSSYSTGNAPATSVNYQQRYKQWANYYNQTEVTCAPGTEQLSVPSASKQGTSVPGVTSGHTNSNNLPPLFTSSWRPDLTSSEFPVQGGPATNGAHDTYWKQSSSNFQNHHTISMQSHFQKPLDSKTSYDNFQEQQKTIPQGPNSQYPVDHQVPRNCQIPVQTVPSLDTLRSNKLQIQTIPRIASNLTAGLSKTDKDVIENGPQKMMC